MLAIHQPQATTPAAMPELCSSSHAGNRAATPEELARSEGYTREVLAEVESYSLELLVQDDADLEGEFQAFCPATGEMLAVNGWNFTFEDLGDEG